MQTELQLLAQILFEHSTENFEIFQFSNSLTTSKSIEELKWFDECTHFGDGILDLILP